MRSFYYFLYYFAATNFVGPRRKLFGRYTCFGPIKIFPGKTLAILHSALGNVLSSSTSAYVNIFQLLALLNLGIFPEEAVWCPSVQFGELSVLLFLGGRGTISRTSVVS